LKITTVPIGNNRSSADIICKGGSYLLCLRKLVDFRLKEKLAGAVSVYDQRGLADLDLPGVKLVDMDGNVKGIVL
jgi:hypothetical protein